MAGGLGCGAADPPRPIARDCATLLAAAARAQACDPAIEGLMTSIRGQPDALTCRIAARSVLREPATRSVPSVRSVFDDPMPTEAAPLSDDETAKLLRLPRPAQVIVTPDIAPEAGVAPTTATIDALPLDTEPGRLRAFVGPGRRTLVVHHAGKQTSSCVVLLPCETLALTAHGSKLARHRSVTSGPCPS